MNDVEEDDDLRFLEEIEGKSVDSASLPDLSDSDDDRFPSYVDENGESEESESEQDSHDLDPDTYKAPVFDEKDVVVLTEGDFSNLIGNNKYVMVDFYAPWCGHSQAFAPEYAAAATELKGGGVVLAKVDAIMLRRRMTWQKCTTCRGSHCLDAILTWIKKNIGPGVFNVTNLDDAERISTSRSIGVLGYLNSLVVWTSTRDSAPSIFESSIKNHLLLLATLNISEKFIPVFQEAAKLFKGKILAYPGTDARKFAMDGDVTLDNIKVMVLSILQCIYLSNDEDVKVVVANSFNDIILDKSKDVLLEKAGFPTILFFPAGNKNKGERSVVAYYKFLKKHASIPFKLQKPFSTPKDKPASDHETKESDKSSSVNTKDEL
ncbi:Disulfide isomerase L-2 isoform 3 [Hibiscus syriacus]|uniref:Disulfide isomerase L-2 isoform 3 n=1 Tax=Hibiscus syriacus TaxID=106335 RepID=A0A6A2Z9T8_HIBSY|nr:Disulfide isomerase L-2 isoform 3 [Hibiscus syriacus]